MDDTRVNPTLAPIIRAWLTDHRELLDTIFDEVAEQMAAAIAAEVVTNLVRTLRPTRGDELLRSLVLSVGGTADFLKDLVNAGKLENTPAVKDSILQLYQDYAEGMNYLGNSFLEDVQADLGREVPDHVEEGGTP